MNLWKNMDLERRKRQKDIATRDIIIFGGYQAGKSSVIRTLLNEDAPTEILDLATLSQVEDLVKKLGKFSSAIKEKKVKLAIVANKYDQFSSLKSDVKAAVNEFLKVSSKYLKASLIQCSCTQESQKTILRRFFQSEVFHLSAVSSLSESSTDNSQPLVLLQGAQKVQVTSTVDSAAIELSQVVEQERIKSSSMNQRQPENMDNFADSEIDGAVRHFHNHREYSKLAQLQLS
ncbi:Oidioi.mRNA.OKI2018_I69.XSR.g13821.t1.cds [Oikopleura dioica]|uniref:Cytoplasmic dynein 2 light intermediate chain 1 n=1 Tax=Oikopleura dioica TaxID=34765 RepID=A0ABN7SF18_OIKDI|nr:Oidioi.mRNA.OKI2018_I69.XSR.g13821.t1.cds [Oikopleura dioica]